MRAILVDGNHHLANERSLGCQIESLMFYWGILTVNYLPLARAVSTLQILDADLNKIDNARNQPEADDPLLNQSKRDACTRSPITFSIELIPKFCHACHSFIGMILSDEVC